jgi:hypothetical protein
MRFARQQDFVARAKRLGGYDVEENGDVSFCL